MSEAILDLTYVADTSMLQKVICVECDADSSQSADLEGQSKRVTNASTRVVINRSIDDLPPVRAPRIVSPRIGLRMAASKTLVHFGFVHASRRGPRAQPRLHT